MSRTAARGFADATRWVGVAASMVEYLDDLLAADSSARPAPPPRTVASAKRFLSWVLEGIAISRRSGTARHVPTMAALSSFTIAMEVFSARPPVTLGQAGSTEAALTAVESSVQAYLQCLDALEDPARRDAVSGETARALREFLHDLLRHGNAARYAEFAQGEQPVR